MQEIYPNTFLIYLFNSIPSILNFIICDLYIYIRQTKMKNRLRCFNAYRTCIVPATVTQPTRIIEMRNG
jgi:hypothetical protein